MISSLPCKRKITIDIREPFSNNDVEGITGDYLEWQAEKLDIITCLQVLEHIDDDHIEKFAHKLLNDAPTVVISVPYMWPKGSDIDHKQDPVDVDKLIKWFGIAPVYIHKITEPIFTNKSTRIIAIFIRDAESEINLDYWRNDAQHISRHNRNKRLSRLIKRFFRAKIIALKKVKNTLIRKK